MTDWEPATEAEIAMRGALRTADQERYFTILARTELLLPVSPDALAGRAPMGWGTWNSGGRTHVLAFTSTEAMQACLAEHAESARKIAYHELAAAWPNHEWWLAVNPGLPIEGYLPPWFVSQLARGDVRMPGRTAAHSRSNSYADVGSSGRDWSGFGPDESYAGSSYPDHSYADDSYPDQPYAEPTYQPHASRSSGSFQRGGGAAAATGARREARATATASWSTYEPEASDNSASGADEPIEAEMIDNDTAARSGAHSAGRTVTANGRPGAGRRPRRHDATIIDAEIIESTVLGATALDALVVNATVIDASMIDSDVIDATLVEMSVEDTGARRRAGAVRAGLAAAPPELPEPADQFERAESAPAAPAAGRSDMTAASVDDASPTRPITVQRPSRERAAQRSAANPPADATQRIDVSAPAASTADASPTRPIRVNREPAPDETQRIDIDRADSSPTRPMTTGRPGHADLTAPQPAPDATQRIHVQRPADATQRIHVQRPADATQRIHLRPPVDATQRIDPADADASVTRRIERAAAIVSPADTGSGAAAGSRPAEPESADDATTVISEPAREPAGATATDTRASVEAMTDEATTEDLSADEPPAPSIDPAVASFVPANDLEGLLATAVASGQTEQFLSTLLLAKVLVPVADGGSAETQLDNNDFPWRHEEVEGQQYVVVFTSPERMGEFLGDGASAVMAKFIQLIHVWPDVKWAFAINPGSPISAMLPGIQIKALAAWADDVGLTNDEGFGEYDDARSGPPEPNRPVVMQKPIAASQVDYYLERGYDRASGFVHRATEILQLQTPAQLIESLGLTYSGSPFRRDAKEVYLLRWSAFRPDLYRIPYGGQTEAAMHAMQGWIIERAPFRGNGFAPAEDGQVIAEFKVDSIRLPHGAQMWRLTSDGRKTLIALLDADECLWRPVRGIDSEAVWDPAVPVVVPTPSVEPAKPGGR